MNDKLRAAAEAALEAMVDPDYHTVKEMLRAALAEKPRMGVLFVDGIGAMRSSPGECRDGVVAYVLVDEHPYWPLNAADVERLNAATIGRGEFNGPSAALAEPTGKQPLQVADPEMRRCPRCWEPMLVPVSAEQEVEQEPVAWLSLSKLNEFARAIEAALKGKNV